MTRNDLLGAAYSEVNDIGDRQTTGVESLAIDLIELSALHDKKMKPYKKDIVIFNQTLKQFNQIDQSNLYYAINNQHEIFTNKELQLIIMRFGSYIEDNHHIEQNKKSRDEREQYINKLIANVTDNQLVV